MFRTDEYVQYILTLQKKNKKNKPNAPTACNCKSESDRL